MLRFHALLIVALTAGCTSPAPSVQAEEVQPEAASARTALRAEAPPPPAEAAQPAELPRRVNTIDEVVTCSVRPDYDAYTVAVRKRGAELSDQELVGSGLTCTRGILWPESEFAVLDSTAAPHTVKIRVYAITGVEVDVWAPGVVLEQ